MSEIRVKEKAGRTYFNCTGCKTIIPIGVYAVAQCAMGHKLVHTCDCGKKHEVSGRAGRYNVRALKP